jgi:hypothetical protein
VTPWLIRHVSLTDMDGFVIYSNLNEENVDAAITGEVEYFAAIKQDFEWKVYDYDQPPDLKDRLRAHGFTIGDAEALLVLDLADRPAVLSHTISPYVKAITDAEGVDAIIAMENEIWHDNPVDLGEQLKRDLLNEPDQLSIYAAYVDGKPVSAAWMYLHTGTSFASLWGGSTLPGYRRLGLYTSLLAARAQQACQRGFRFLTVDASPMSRPILEKRGFQLLGFSYPCKSKRD